MVPIETDKSDSNCVRSSSSFPRGNLEHTGSILPVFVLPNFGLQDKVVHGLLVVRPVEGEIYPSFLTFKLDR